MSPHNENGGRRSKYDGIIDDATHDDKNNGYNILNYLMNDFKNDKSENVNIPYWFENILPIIIEKEMINKENKKYKKNKKNKTNKNLAKGKIYSFIQNEGDTVYIPNDWPHAVLNLDFSVSITHNIIHKSDKNQFFDWINENREVLQMDDRDIKDCKAIINEIHK